MYETPIGIDDTTLNESLLQYAHYAAVIEAEGWLISLHYQDLK